MGGDTAGAQLGDREVPLRLVPGAQEAVHVEVCHSLGGAEDACEIIISISYT